MKKQYKYLLNENDIPKQWYNIVPDLPNPLPPQLNPQTMEPIGPEDLAPLFPMGLIFFIILIFHCFGIIKTSPMYRAQQNQDIISMKWLSPSSAFYNAILKGPVFGIDLDSTNENNSYLRIHLGA